MRRNHKHEYNVIARKILQQWRYTFIFCRIKFVLRYFDNQWHSVYTRIQRYYAINFICLKRRSGFRPRAISHGFMNNEQSNNIKPQCGLDTNHVSDDVEAPRVVETDKSKTIRIKSKTTCFLTNLSWTRTTAKGIHIY